MDTGERLKIVEEFLDWIDSETYYEIGETEQSDWGDGESSFHQINFESLLKEYKDSLGESNEQEIDFSGTTFR